MSSQDVLFHGTCRLCKHFHKNWEFSLPPPGTSGRVKCERCEGEMFAFGRAGTQDTLASVDSIPLSQLRIDANAARARHSNVPQFHSSILRDVAHQRRPFSEEHQTHASANGESHATESRPTESYSETPVESDGIRSHSHRISSMYLRLFQRLPYHQALLGASGYINAFGTRVAAGLPQTRREYSIFGWRFVMHPPDNHADAPAYPQLNTTQDLGYPAGDVQTDSLTLTEALNESNSITPSALTHLPSVEDLTQAAHTDDTVNAPAGTERPSDRLTQRRRQNTLTRAAFQQFNCRCTGDCHCILRAAEPLRSESDAQSSRIGSPPPPDQVPTDPLIDRLGGVQNDLHFSYWAPSTESSDQSRNTSQASTLGSGASISLDPRQPRLTARAHSMPRHM